MGCGGSKSTNKVAVASDTEQTPDETNRKEVSRKTKVRVTQTDTKVTRVVETVITFDDGSTKTETADTQVMTRQEAEMNGIIGGKSGDTTAPDITDEESDRICKELVDEITAIRTRPADYAVHVEEMKSRFQGGVVFFPGRPPIKINEGAAVFEDAMQFLQKQAAVGVVTWADGLAKACKDLVKDCEKTGMTSSAASDGSDFDARIERYGDYSGRVAEILSFNKFTARDIVLGWLLSDSDPNRSNRQSLFDPLFSVVGSNIGNHPKATSMCCTLLAFSFQDGTVEAS
eukprot:NODE_379_length_1568_cov_38.582235_g347_i0.p1 GENE.NODE_379_length_1568_cov_38.582235_g347_i0~~NODE_379_length_1568_cov_38.582235_g347_i0.p1  ORF type:complete len:318 (+),score=53.00 NODE_379_length_1568_cov_38.582235_g347_i0:95-955(+)